MELTQAAMGIPLWIILIPFGIFLIVFFIYSAFNFYHLIRFGVYSYGLYLIATLYLLVVIGILSVAVFFLMGYDFSSAISFETLFGSSAGKIIPGL
jgi:hypothetical protein